MKRKELKKAIKKYSHDANFYKLGLVRRFIQYEERTIKELKTKIPKVTCPKCGNSKIDIEYDEREYNCNNWLYCEECGHEFDDNFGYVDAANELECFSWYDGISNLLYFDKPDTTTYEWQQYCEKEILRMLNEEKDEDIFV